MKIFFLAILSYLIGSLPTAYLITKKIKGEDIRKFGSGNIGATNAARVLGIKMGLIVALVDILKGYFAVILIQLILPQQTPLYIIFLLYIVLQTIIYNATLHYIVTFKFTLYTFYIKYKSKRIYFLTY